jgi:hypothetical protein
MRSRRTTATVMVGVQSDRSIMATTLNCCQYSGKACQKIPNEVNGSPNHQHFPELDEFEDVMRRVAKPAFVEEGFSRQNIRIL